MHPISSFWPRRSIGSFWVPLPSRAHVFPRISCCLTSHYLGLLPKFLLITATSKYWHMPGLRPHFTSLASLMTSSKFVALKILTSGWLPCLYLPSQTFLLNPEFVYSTIHSLSEYLRESHISCVQNPGPRSITSHHLHHAYLGPAPLQLSHVSGHNILLTGQPALASLIETRLTL